MSFEMAEIVPQKDLTGNPTAISCTAVRETGVSQHHPVHICADEDD